MRISRGMLTMAGLSVAAVLALAPLSAFAAEPLEDGETPAGAAASFGVPACAGAPDMSMSTCDDEAAMTDAGGACPEGEAKTSSAAASACEDEPSGPDAPEETQPADAGDEVPSDGSLGEQGSSQPAAPAESACPASAQGPSSDGDVAAPSDADGEVSDAEGPATSRDGSSAADADTPASEPPSAGGEPSEQGASQTGWVTRDGASYYLGADGKPLVGEQQIDGAWYYLDPSAGGAMATGLVRQTVSSGSGSFKLAYYDESGRRVSGLRTLSGVTYRFDEKTGARMGGFVLRDDGSADMLFFDPASGALVTGSRELHGGERYFDAQTGVMATGITQVPASAEHPARTVCFDGFGGTLETGVTSVDGSTYYFDESDGAMVTDGWRWTPEGLITYYRSDGRQARGTTWVGGEHYWFDERTGASSYAQFLRWNLAHASGSARAAFFNGARFAQWATDEVARAVADFNVSGYSVGYVMMDIATGRGISAGIDDTFYSASTVKAPYVASVYSDVFCSNVGASAPWYETLYDTCVWSDNDAYFAFRNAYGNDVFASWLYGAGVDPSEASHYYAHFTPRDLGKMWLRMYDYFDHAGAAGSELGNLLSHGYCSSIFNELGDEYPVRSKAGWYPEDPGYTATNDAGIVYARNGAYLVVVLSDAPERFDLTQALVRALDDVHETMS